MNNKPWYKWAHRWNQVNSSEIDPRDCDLEVWRKYWRDNGIQGTIVNAAGTVAYYQSAVPYQYRAKYLGDRDYYADFCRVAKEEGLAIVARMDSNQATEELLEAHPDWFCRTKDGKPIQCTEHRYYTCINGGYYTQQLSKVIEEIITKYKPDALADNSWAGSRGFICYCDNCRKRFKEDTGLDLPEAVDYEDRTFRVWMDWNRKIRTGLYAWFNELSTRLGGEDCVYMGMLHPDAYSDNPVSMTMDYVEYGAFNKAAMIDGQIRMSSTGFDANALQGLATHEIFGDDTLIIESVASYHFAPDLTRKSANTKEETQSWMRSALIGGVSPSVHFIGGIQEDKRVFENGADIFRWHKENEEYLYDRTPVSNVGLVRSLRNTYYYGKADCAQRVIRPMDGMVAALKRGRIPFFPIDARQIKDKLYKTKVLILPDIAVLTDEELETIEDYIRSGGSIVFSGATGMLDEYGYPRKSFPLDDILGITREEKEPIDIDFGGGIKNIHDYSHHNYIRIDEPRHEIMAGFEKTAIIDLRGLFYHVRSEKLKPIAHMVPPMPIYPPEASYIEDGQSVSDDPAILAGETGYGGRAVYFAADFDRRYGTLFFPDHGNLLKNAILWAMNGDRPFTVEGPGELDCKLYAQKDKNRLVMQILNHSGLGKWPGCVEEFYTVGPLKVEVATGDMTVNKVTLRNLGTDVPFTRKDGKTCFSISQIYDQELIVIQ